MSISDSALDSAELSVARPKSKALPVLVGLNVLLVVGVVVLLLKKPGPAAPAPAEAATAAAPTENAEQAGEAAPGPTLKLDNFIIQLKAVESDRYVRVAFDVELSSEADRTIVGARMSQIRDLVIAYFSDRTLEELRGSTGLDRTKTELVRRLDTVVPGHRIKALYITDFVVQ